jgi:AcrR family transcriptional regulator
MSPGKRALSERTALDRSLHNGIGRERVSSIQRSRMLTATFEIVGERGAAGASVAHVVGRSGVSRRTFYEIFEDREDCFLAAFEEAVQCGSERVIAASEGEARWRDRMRAGLTAMLQFLDDEPLMSRLLVIEALAAGPKALRRRSIVLARIIAAVEEGRTDSKFIGEPSLLTAEGVVGAVFSVLHTRMLEGKPKHLLELASSLMSMIVLPYLGPAVARKELQRPVPPRRHDIRSGGSDPLRDLEMRLTYRTVRVLIAIADRPRASNRQIAEVAGVSDQGQMSKLLGRLESLGLIENGGVGSARGEPNAWALTPTGLEVEQTIRA